MQLLSPMNLRQMSERLSTAPIDSGRLVLNPNNVITNIPAFKFLVEHLADLPPLAAMAEQIRQSRLWNIGGEAFGFEANQAQQLKQLGDEFWLTAQGLKNSLPSFVPSVAAESIVVQFPDRRDDLATVVSLLDKLQSALGQLVTEKDIGGELRVQNWEKGSLLIFLWLKTLAAVDLVARTLKSAAVVYQEIQKGRLLGQHVRSLKIKNDMVEILQQAQAEAVKALIQREAAAIDTESFSERDHERSLRIENSIRLFAELITDGTRIYPALEMPPDHKDQFPKFDQLPFLDSPIKHLENIDAPVTDPEEQTNSGPD